jgi:hypothetical protein
MRGAYIGRAIRLALLATFASLPHMTADAAQATATSNFGGAFTLD